MSSTIKVGLSTEMETEQQHFERLYATMKAKKATKDEQDKTNRAQAQLQPQKDKLADTLTRNKAKRTEPKDAEEEKPQQEEVQSNSKLPGVLLRRKAEREALQGQGAQLELMRACLCRI